MAHREHLKAAGVGDDRPVPVHEPVQSAEALDQLSTGVEHQVKRVAQHHVVAEILDLYRQQSLDGGLGGKWREGRCANIAVGGAQPSGAGISGAVAHFDGEGHDRAS